MVLNRIHAFAIYLVLASTWMVSSAQADPACGCEATSARSCCHSFGKHRKHSGCCCQKQPEQQARTRWIESPPRTIILDSMPVARAMPMMISMPMMPTYRTVEEPAPRSLSREKTCESTSRGLTDMNNEVSDLRRQVNSIQDAVLLQKQMLLEIRECLKQNQ